MYGKPVKIVKYWCNMFFYTGQYKQVRKTQVLIRGILLHFMFNSIKIHKWPCFL